MKWTPHAYQQRAMSLMMQQASLGLFLDPGLGKTATWLGAFCTLKELGMVDKMLVIAPLKPLYGTWPTEIQKYDEFKHLSWCFLHGKNKHEALENKDADIYLINPEGIQWLVDSVDPSKLADVLCVDESTKFKNTASKRFKSLRLVFPRFNYRWIGTGTPAPNGLEDLFGQTYILDGGAALGQYITHFRNRWFYTEPWNPYKHIAHQNAFEEITQAIAPLVLVMQAEDYLTMPELNVVDLEIELPPKVRKLYKEIEEDFISQLPSSEVTLVAPSAAAAGAKCRQICNGAVYTEGDSKQYSVVHDEKLEALEELLEEIGEHPTLVVYEFQHDKERLLGKYKDWKCLTGLAGNELQSIIAQFNAGSIPRLLIQSSQAHGLNIQEGCSHMVWFGMTWNWEDYKQMVDRLYRQGQARNMVMVYRLLAKDTLDATMATRLEHKRKEEVNVKNAAAQSRDRRNTGLQ
jgi:SNF2 family DNA or RNA helicase